MVKQLLSTRDIGSGPRDPAILGLLRPQGVTDEQIARATAFLNHVEALPEQAYGVAPVQKSNPSLAEEYSVMARKSFEERTNGAPDLITKIGVVTLHNLGFKRAWDLEWGRTEMVEWECADVGGFSSSKNWQHSYGTRFWKPREIKHAIRYRGNSVRHTDGLARVQKFAKDKIRIPLTDPHCIIHANDNLFYYGRELRHNNDEIFAGLRGDHLAGLDFARKVSRNRVRRIAAMVREGEKIDIQWDNFIVACKRKEFDKQIIKKLGLTVPSYVEILKEITVPTNGIEYSIHNCLQPYGLYVPYLPSAVPGITRFHFEISTHDTNKLGLTTNERTGQGWEAIRQLTESGLRSHQKVIVDVAASYEGATPPDIEVVRDRILYPIIKLGYAPEQIEVAPSCGQRNLSLQTMLNLDINIHKGRDLALKELERRYGIDSEPHLTRSYLREPSV